MRSYLLDFYIEPISQTVSFDLSYLQNIVDEIFSIAQH